jgi:hypothetical protein
MARPRSIRMLEDGTIERHCSFGNHWLPSDPEHFGTNKQRCDGLNPYCKTCNSQRYKDYRRTHPEYSDRINRNQKEWRANNLEIAREKGRISMNKRKARKRELPKKFGPGDSLRMRNYWKRKCAICDCETDKVNPLCSDHWIPINDNDCPGTIPTNMVPLCKRCNSSKGNRRPDDWLFDKYGYVLGYAKLKRVEIYFQSLPQAA